MDSQTASKQIIEICETYKAQHGHYPTELKVNDEIWHALHGEAHFKIVFPLLPVTLNLTDFDETSTIAPPEIPLVNIIPLRRQG